MWILNPNENHKLLGVHNFQLLEKKGRTAIWERAVSRVNRMSNEGKCCNDLQLH